MAEQTQGSQRGIQVLFAQEKDRGNLAEEVGHEDTFAAGPFLENYHVAGHCRWHMDGTAVATGLMLLDMGAVVAVQLIQWAALALWLFKKHKNDNQLKS